MKHLLVASLVVTSGLLAGCDVEETTVDYTTSTETGSACNLDVYSEGLTVSERFKVIGEISVRDTGFTINCSQDLVMSRIRTAACSADADAIQMYNVQPPSLMGSTCFQANARFLKY